MAQLFINPKTGLKEILLIGKLVSIRPSLLKNRFGKEYRICDVEIEYPNNQKAVVSASAYENLLIFFKLKEGDKIKLRIQYEGEYKGKSFVEIPFEDFESISDNKYENILWVLDDFRINPLSLTPGGSDVVIVFNDGSIFGYDKIKYTHSYVEEVLKHEIKLDENVSVGEQLQIVKIAVDSVFVYLNTWAKEIPKNGRVDLKKIWDAKEDSQLPWEKLKAIDC